MPETETTKNLVMNSTEQELVKIVYRDEDRDKVVTGHILDEDNFLISITPLNSNIKMRIGKSVIVSIKPVSNRGGFK